MSGHKGTNGSGKNGVNGPSSPAPPRRSVGSACLSGFSPAQLEKLGQPIDKNHIHARELGGRQLSYIEGWYALAQANEIFGYSGWDRETVHFERVYDKARGDTAICGYVARVRIKVRAGDTVISREGSGWGWALERSVGAAHEKALKTAETDATKRALSTFGSQFGLTLYDKEQNGAADKRRPTLTLFAPDGKSLSDNLTPEGYCSGMRQLADACKTGQELDDLARHNTASLADLRSLAPSLRNADGVHFADLLLSLIGRARRRLGGTVTCTTDTTCGAAAAVGQNTEAGLANTGAEIRQFPMPAEDFSKRFVRAPAVSSQNRSSGLNGVAANAGHSHHGLTGSSNGQLANAGQADSSNDGAAESNSSHSHALNGGLSSGSKTIDPQRETSVSFGAQIVTDEKNGCIAVAPVIAGEVLPSIPPLPADNRPKGQENSSSEPPGQLGPLAPSKISAGLRIDKSVLTIGAERRVRDKDYLKKVRELPCTVCGRQPSHAHHLRFAQARGLSQKVSDEYVVPLCNLHHGDLHHSSDEQTWWGVQKIDPIPVAAELWGRHRELDHAKK